MRKLMRKHALHFKKRGAKFAIPTDVQPGAGCLLHKERELHFRKCLKNMTFFLKQQLTLGFYMFLQYGKSIHIL